MINPAQVKAISLDLDDTLWPIWPVIEAAEAAVQAWLLEHCPRVPEAYGIEELRVLRDSIAEENPARSHDLAFLRRETLSQAILTQGYDQSAVETAYQLFFNVRNQVDLYDDVLPVLNRWVQRYPLIAVTNGNADLGLVGLSSVINDAVRPATVGVAKPHPGIFEEAARRLNVDHAGVLHIGDNLEDDVAGAKAAGMQSIWLVRDPERQAADHQAAHPFVHCLREIDQLLSGH